MSVSARPGAFEAEIGVQSGRGDVAGSAEVIELFDDEGSIPALDTFDTFVSVDGPRVTGAECAVGSRPILNKSEETVP